MALTGELATGQPDGAGGGKKRGGGEVWCGSCASGVHQEGGGGVVGPTDPVASLGRRQVCWQKGKKGGKEGESFTFPRRPHFVYRGERKGGGRVKINAIKNRRGLGDHIKKRDEPRAGKPQ